MSEDNILLSVVVRVVGGARFLRGCLCELIPQIQGHPIEVIVPYDSAINGVQRLAMEFPQVKFLDLGDVEAESQRGPLVFAHQLYDRRTAAGLRVARGEIVALLEDYGVPDRDWCEQMLEAHRLPYAVIGGAVEHSGTGVLNWAVYLLDFARYQLPLSEGPAEYLTDINVSYKRPALESVREAWAQRYNEVPVHCELASKGVKLWQRPQLVVREDRGKFSFRYALAERYAWGRVFGYMRTTRISRAQRFLHIVGSPLIPVVMLLRLARKVLSGRRNRMPFLSALPPMAVLSAAWCLGELAAYLTGNEVPMSADEALPKVNYRLQD